MGAEDRVAVDAAAFAMNDIQAKYDEQPASPDFSRLYEGEVWGHMFAVLHKRLNQHFEEINGRAETTRHYWADNSRELLQLIKDLEADLHNLNRAGVDVTLDRRYWDAIERCRPWLSPSGGSAVPEDFQPIEVLKYDPVFTIGGSTVTLRKQQSPIDLKMIGEGSYANVYAYVDPDYGIKFAVKRAKKGLDSRELYRFRQEFEEMKRLSFPYVLEVYKFNEARNEYSMEHCDETLRKYIQTRNATLPFSTRKRIALQFVYGINYLHSEKLLHRDISLQNVLLKVFKSGAVQVKLSDFGLVKNESSEFTRTQTEMRGTIRDPLLDNFRDYKPRNELYPMGWVLSYIFTGRDSIASPAGEVGRIVQRCTALDMSQRYSSVAELMADLEKLEVAPSATPV